MTDWLQQVGGVASAGCHNAAQEQRIECVCELIACHVFVEVVLHYIGRPESTAPHH